jgi:hypothetical protein
MDYATVFGHPCGQRVLQDILEQCNYYTALYAPGMDQLELAAREGSRQVGIWLSTMVEDALENPQAVPEESTEGQPQENHEDTN